MKRNQHKNHKNTILRTFTAGLAVLSLLYTPMLSNITYADIVVTDESTVSNNAENTDTYMAEDVELDISEASTSSEASTLSSDSIELDVDEDLDYILDRPMTKEEIQEQLDLIPDDLVPLPEEDPVDDYIPENLTEDVLNTASLFSLFEEESLLTASDTKTLPAYYDGRNYNYLTSVKDQGSTGTCWAFASLASFETSLIKRNIINDVDLSEFHLAYYGSHTGYDELGNTCDLNGSNKVDYCSGTGNYLAVGGTYSTSTTALSNWKGAPPIPPQW